MTHRGRDPVAVRLRVPNEGAILDLASAFHREGVAQHVVHADLLLAASFIPVGAPAYAVRTIDPFQRGTTSETLHVHHEHASALFWILGTSWTARVVWSNGPNASPVVTTTSAASKRPRSSVEERQLRLALDDSAQFVEGDVSVRMHLERERNREVVEHAKRFALKKHGKLACEICCFDFSVHYGERGGGYIEAHHRVPLSSLTGPATVRIDDFALVCANCHRMLHRGNPWPTVDELKFELEQRVVVQGGGP